MSRRCDEDCVTDIAELEMQGSIFFREASDDALLEIEGDAHVT